MVLGRGWKRREAFGAKLARPTRQVGVVELWNVAIVILGGSTCIRSWERDDTLATATTATYTTTMVTASTAACVEFTSAGVVRSSHTLLRRR